MQRAHVMISGRVQGVFFRAFARESALQLGLRGFVRNVPSGEVETVVEGDEEKISKLIDALKKGPPASRVEDVKIKWQDYKDEFDDFRITR